MNINLNAKKVTDVELTHTALKSLYKEKGNKLFCYCGNVRKDWKGNTHINFYESWNYADTYNNDSNSFVRNLYIPTTAMFIEFNSHEERNIFRDLFYANAKNGCKLNPRELISSVLE